MAKAKKSKPKGKPKVLSGLSRKELKKLQKERAAQLTPVSFDDHLARLAIWYGVQEDKILRVDQIFNGTWDRNHGLEVDEVIVLLPKIAEHMMTVWDRYGARPNVLTDEMFGHLVEFTDTIPVELAVMLQMQIWRSGFAIKTAPKGTRLRLIHKGEDHNHQDVSVWTKEEF